MNNQVFDNKGTEITIQAFHPGIFLLEEIEERKLMKKELARELGVLPNNLSQIFTGKRNISITLALKLEKVLGISAEYWIGLQTAYDLQEARKEAMAH
ncbi:HigA family addiction module antitoxin [Pedobacter gandavensis]|uniref:HigA family addiction module antitoxin n=1 Tax=Pedobacter gandavensis TaxID=2679963 RepID=UPI0029304DAA|nr:HigA family addiction module antitoxin [Pedobacter gandavensis]